LKLAGKTPASRPDYSIERAEPLIIRHQDHLIWPEPPVILDAKYYLEGSDPEQTHSPVKKLLGDMTLLEAEVGMLFFPRLPEPTDSASMTRMIRKSRERYTPQGETTQQVHLYHLEPSMPLSQVQHRLRAVLDLATQHLPERSEPACEGTWLDPDTVHAGRRLLPSHTILCPKRHIGPNIADLVNVDRDCLKNPLLCHVMDQPIVPPFVVRVTTQEQLVHRSNDLRSRSEEQLHQAEANSDEIRAESMRQHIFTGIGRAVEQYVKLFANTSAIENMFEAWIFGEHWKNPPAAWTNMRVMYSSVASLSGRTIRKPSCTIGLLLPSSTVVPLNTRFTAASTNPFVTSTISLDQALL
jgi:hypothetical protein